MFRPLNRFRARLRALRRSRKGTAAVEFAIIAPMMISMLFGTVEIVDALGTSQRAENTAASIADVVSRDDAISNSELTDIWEAADALMYPDNPENLQVCISAVMINSENDAEVLWSESNRGCPSPAAGSPVSLDPGMMTPGSSLIVARTRYTYHSPLGLLFGAAVTMDHSAQRRARIVDPVTRTN